MPGALPDSRISAVRHTRNAAMILVIAALSLEEHYLEGISMRW